VGFAGRQDGVLERLLGHDSPGEFIDRMQILQLKSERFRDEEKRRAAKRRYQDLELIRQLLDVVVATGSGEGRALREAETRLWTANSTLWYLEEEIRRLASIVDARFDDLELLRRHARVATGIHEWNDRRSRAKREIDKIFLWDRSELKGFGAEIPAEKDCSHE